MIHIKEFLLLRFVTFFDKKSITLTDKSAKCSGFKSFVKKKAISRIIAQFNYQEI